MTAKNNQDTKNKRPRQQFKRIKRDIHGILLLDKPTGITSNNALQQVKHALEARKAGHTGSLDPLASGLLPLCFGEATKISTYLLEADKTYIVTAKLGVKTDSADSDGAVIETQDVPRLDLDTIQAVLDSFLGDSQQIPPMYSALKHEGQRLYKLARKGEVVDRPPRAIYVSHIELNTYADESLSLTVTVSKGTYIRSLVEDIAVALGTVAHVTVLRRTGVYPYTNPMMITLDAFLELSAEDKQARLMSIESGLSHWQTITLNAEQTQDIKHGKRVVTQEINANDKVLVLDNAGKPLALGEISDKGLLKPKRLLLLPS